MKTVKLVLLLMGAVFAGNVSAADKEIASLTTSYYGVKDALVADDAKTAKAKASEFLASLNGTTTAGFTTAQLKVWNAQVQILRTTSSAIAAATEIEKQRAQLNAMSEAFFAVLKAFDGNGNVVYYQYCPMKKTYWLSSEKAIKNPYYGSKMLTCGKVVETLG